MVIFIFSVAILDAILDFLVPQHFWQKLKPISQPNILAYKNLLFMIKGPVTPLNKRELLER
jgi:hypothetical protein